MVLPLGPFEKRHLWLGDMETLGDLTTTLDNEANRYDVKLSESAFKHQAQWEVFQNSVGVHKHCHQHHPHQVGRHRQALEVLALTGGVLGDVVGGDVETGQSRQAAENPEGQEKHVHR